MDKAKYEVFSADFLSNFNHGANPLNGRTIIVISIDHNFAADCTMTGAANFKTIQIKIPAY